MQKQTNLIELVITTSDIVKNILHHQIDMKQAACFGLNKKAQNLTVKWNMAGKFSKHGNGC